LNNSSALSTRFTRLETKEMSLQAQSEEKTEFAASLPKLWERFRSDLFTVSVSFFVIFSLLIPSTRITKQPTHGTGFMQQFSAFSTLNPVTF
jgi:hypothetical protein